MLPLMNYSTNNIPQYQQPIYQNPYMDNRMANLQALQQSLQPMQGTVIERLYAYRRRKEAKENK